MADTKPYPQLPVAIWWAFRDMVKAKPTLQLIPKTVAVQFGVQESAAKAYISELQKTGLLDEESRATDLARKWRIDDTYLEAVEEIIANAYPEDLADALGNVDIDREKAKQWFMLDGLGSGTANNKAATLSLISSSTPGEAPRASSKTPPAHNGHSAKKSTTPSKEGKTAKNPPQRPSGQSDFGPLNVNVQIHISADASTDQIETIFAAMNKHLRND